MQKFFYPYHIGAVIWLLYNDRSPVFARLAQFPVLTHGARHRGTVSSCLLPVTSLFRLPFLGRSVPPAVLSADGRILTKGTLNMAVHTE